jgi:hypothetical protein
LGVAKLIPASAALNASVSADSTAASACVTAQAASSLPMLVREIPAAEIKLPIGNR